MCHFLEMWKWQYTCQWWHKTMTIPKFLKSQFNALYRVSGSSEWGSDFRDSQMILLTSQQLDSQGGHTKRIILSLQFRPEPESVRQQQAQKPWPPLYPLTGNCLSYCLIVSQREHYNCTTRLSCFNLVRQPNLFLSFVFDNQGFDPHLYLLLAWHVSFQLQVVHLLAFWFKNKLFFSNNLSQTAYSSPERTFWLAIQQTKWEQCDMQEGHLCLCEWSEHFFFWYPVNLQSRGSFHKSSLQKPQTQIMNSGSFTFHWWFLLTNYR